MITKLINSRSLQETLTYSIQQSNQLKSFITHKQERVFGMEYYQDYKSKKFHFFSHESSPINEPPVRPIVLDPMRSNQSCYYFHFQKPSFLPFSFKHHKDFWGLLEKNVGRRLKQNTKLFLQVIHQYDSNDKWRHEAYQKYNDYLNGIESPSSNRHILNLQYKLLDIFKPPHKPIEVEEAISKIEQNGYMTAMRLIIEGGEKAREQIANKVKLTLNHSRYMNAWDWNQAISKRRFIEDAQMRIFPFRYRNQILCTSELQFFFGGGEVIQETVKVESIDSLITHGASEDTTDIVIDSEFEEVVGELTAAMKKLKLLKNDKLKVVDTRSSLTLNIISFERPSNLNIEQLRRRTEDIEIEMHIEGISFDQGSEKGSIAFMYPRKDRKFITLEDMLEDKEFKLFKGKNELPIIVGMDMYGDPLHYDLSKLVHVLIAGETGSGKSVFLNVLLFSLVHSLSPEQLHLYLIDPKRVELTDYKDIPHLQMPIANANNASEILTHIIGEMEKRYKLMEEARVKNIVQYNKKNPNAKWAYKVVVIDEFADLMLIDNSVEQFVQRLGQMARAAGIHIILATQRPSVNVVTGVIKANMVTRIGFTCKSHHDYRTIFDYMIPYRLVGKGDGVISWHGNDAQFVRFQSPISKVSEDDKDESIFDKIIDKWGKREGVTEKPKQNKKPEPVDERFELLKKAICETGETRTRQLREMTRMNQNKLNEYLEQLIEDEWLERSENKRGGLILLLDESEREEYLAKYSSDEE